MTLFLSFSKDSSNKAAAFGAVWPHGLFAKTVRPAVFDGFRGHGVRVLNGEALLPEVLSLHRRLCDELPESRKFFLLARPSAFFEELLLGKRGALLGMVRDGRLVGMTAVKTSSSLVKALDAGLLSFPDETGVWGRQAPESLAVIQSLGVLLSARGRGYAHALIEASTVWAAARGCPHLFAQVAATNGPSLVRFLEQGFDYVLSWKKEHRRVLLRKDVFA